MLTGLEAVGVAVVVRFEGRYVSIELLVGVAAVVGSVQPQGGRVGYRKGIGIRW